MLFFLENFYVSLFRVTKSHQKVMSKVRTIVFCINIIKIIIFAPQRKALASGILAMPLNFFLFGLKDFFLLTGTRKGSNTLKGPANLRKFAPKETL